MFIAALFTIARTWKKPKCPSTEKWVKKIWYTHTHTHTQLNIAQLLERNNAIGSKMDVLKRQPY